MVHFNYDVFLSHSAKDKPIIRELAKRLKSDGIRVWLDEWEIKPGDNIGLKIEEGIEQSRILILAMSVNSFASEWVTLERNTVLFRDPTNAQRSFIPLRLDNTDIKDILKQFAYIDWRYKSSEEYRKLLAICYPKEIKDNVSLKKNFPKESESIKILQGHTELVVEVAISDDGCKAVSASADKTIRVWDLESGKCIRELKGHSNVICSIAMTANGEKAISGSYDKTVRIWDIITGKCICCFNKHSYKIQDVAITIDGKYGASISNYGEIYVWDINNSKPKGIFLTGKSLLRVAITEDGEKVIASSVDHKIYVWDVETGKNIFTLNSNTIANGLAITRDGKKIVSGGDDNIIRIWNLDTKECIALFEGHTGTICSIAISANEKIIISASTDKTIRAWDLKTGICLDMISVQEKTIYGVDINAKGDRIIFGLEDYSIIVCELSLSKPQVQQKVENIIRYTNAKVLLVGDSGVGKSGLAIRLTENRFMATSSTDGVWATQLKLPYLTSSSEFDREIWLWDFAGQSDYRLIHQLFMDETSLAMLVFNPQTENPFEGLSQWSYCLQNAARRKFKKLLVAGRCDRGGITVSKDSIDDFYLKNDFNGFFETSATTGKGCIELKNAIIETIDWGSIPWTSSPHIFHVLKNEIIKLKDEGKVLLRLSELKQQLEIRLQKESFTTDELNAVVGLLAGPGLVWKLEFGNFILMEPERINSYAAALIRKVRTHIEEIGIISEEDVLSGKLDYQDMKRLPTDEEQIVLRAMHQTFIDHNLCIREQTEAGSFLVFPSYFKRERPELESHPAIIISYKFKGNLDDIYSTLIVRLHHTSAFNKDQLWKFAADFKTQTNQKIGLKMTKLKESTAEIEIYFEPKISDDTKVTFIKYVHGHLKEKASDIIRLRHYICPYCDTPVVDHKTVSKKIEDGKKDIVCLECEERISLWDVLEEKFASEQIQIKVNKLDEDAQASIDNESKELILVGHAFAIAGEAGQIFRPTPNSDWGIDGEIEFKNEKGQASGKRLYLQLKSGDSYLYTRKKDKKEIFKIKNKRQAVYWVSQAYPVMLVIRTSDSQIRWMNVTEYLNQSTIETNEIIFEGEAFTALNILNLKDKIFGK